MTWFGTYIGRRELIVHPYWEYYRDRNWEYKPQQLVMSWPECKVANSVPASERASRGGTGVAAVPYAVRRRQSRRRGMRLRNHARRARCYSAAG